MDQPDILSGKKILIVEDDFFIRDLYARQFGKNGCQVVESETVDQSLEIVKTDRPDLVLLDIMLPGKSGLDLLLALKQQPETAQIPVILLTNVSANDVIEKGFKLGALGYLV